MIHFIEEINMRLWILVMVVSFTPWLVQAELPLGEVPPLIELSGDKGGRVNGESWSSSELQGKVFSLFYVDPDEADLNNDASEAIKAEDFDKQKYGSVAVINGYLDAQFRDPNEIGKQAKGLSDYNLRQRSGQDPGRAMGSC